MNKNGKQSLLSITLTILVIAIYLIPNFATAVSVSVFTSKPEYVPDEEVQADLNLMINPNERIPITDLSLELDAAPICSFAVNGTPTTPCLGIEITPLSTGSFGTGNLSGTDEATLEFTNFGYGYGLDQGYTGNLSYHVKLNSTFLGITPGNHTLTLDMNADSPSASHIYSGEASFSVVSLTTLQIPLKKGQNLVSIPLVLENESVRNIFKNLIGDFNVINLYDAQSVGTEWKGFDPAAPDFLNSLTEIHRGQGFWINMSKDTTLNVTGIDSLNFTLNMANGWNMIGYPFTTGKPIEAFLGNYTNQTLAAWIYDPFDVGNEWKVFDPKAPAFLNSLTTATSGFGYWINLNASAP